MHPSVYTFEQLYARIIYICVVSPSLHPNISLSNTTSPLSSAASSPSLSLDVKSLKPSQDNKAAQKQKSVDSKKIICAAIERILCVDMQVSFCILVSQI